MSKLTDDELKELVNELNTSVETSKKTFQILQNVLTGGVNDYFAFEGKNIPSLNARIKMTIDQAIKDGMIEMPKGRTIKDIYMDEDGKMVVDYGDEDE